MADVLSPASPFKAEVEQLLDESGVKAAGEEILGPFADITARISEAL